MARTIVLILEGVSDTLLNRWMDTALPALATLRRDGAFGPLVSLPTPYEPPALSSAFTGAPPNQHGCYSYWHVHGPTYDAIPAVVQADDLRAPLLWNQPAAAGLRVGIVNLFGTHPPRPLNGYLISYPLYPTLHACMPPRLLRELSQQGIRYGHDVSALYTGAPRDEFVALVERVEQERIRACLGLLTRDCDLYVFNSTIIDRLSHFWWSEVEPESGVDVEASALWRAYRLADAFVAQLLERLAADDHLIVFSEIGFGPLRRFVSVNDILAQAGLLRIRDGQIDLAHTYAMEAVQGSHGINLHLQRRHAGGLIAPADEAVWRAEVRAALLAATNAETGLPLFAAVHDGATCHPDGVDDAAPDLVLEPYDERYQPLGHPYWAHKVHRRLQTGWHRRTSFWAGVGPRFAAGVPGALAHCTDIAHTIAGCLDLPPLASSGQTLTTCDMYPLQQL